MFSKNKNSAPKEESKKGKDKDKDKKEAAEDKDKSDGETAAEGGDFIIEMGDDDFEGGKGDDNVS